MPTSKSSQTTAATLNPTANIWARRGAPSALAVAP